MKAYESYPAPVIKGAGYFYDCLKEAEKERGDLSDFFRIVIILKLIFGRRCVIMSNK